MEFDWSKKKQKKKNSHVCFFLDFKPGRGEIIRAIPTIHKTYEVSFNIKSMTKDNKSQFHHAVFRFANNEGMKTTIFFEIFI